MTSGMEPSLCGAFAPTHNSTGQVKQEENFEIDESCLAHANVHLLANYDTTITVCTEGVDGNQIASAEVMTLLMNVHAHTLSIRGSSTI